MFGARLLPGLTPFSHFTASHRVRPCRLRDRMAPKNDHAKLAIYHSLFCPPRCSGSFASASHSYRSRLPEQCNERPQGRHLPTDSMRARYSYTDFVKHFIRFGPPCFVELKRDDVLEERLRPDHPSSGPYSRLHLCRCKRR